MNIDQKAREYYDYMIAMRRHFHAHPEVSREEHQTAKRIRQELDEMGISWRPCGFETGTLATIKGSKPGRTILLRGDIDALTVEEETGLPFASENKGIMHACGHDCHAATLLTAARILNEMKDELSGTVKLAFQPAEEVGEGALSMIEQGALDGVDGCFGIHVMPDLDAGKVSICAGPRMSAADVFFIDVAGKGGHGSTPHQCIDAVIVTSAIVNNLQTIVSREIDPFKPAVLTIGRIEAGTRSNIIAEYGKLEGTIRYYDPSLAPVFRNSLERIVADTAHTFRAETHTRYINVMPPTINDPEVTEIAISAGKKILGEEAVISTPPLTSSEDFAFYMQKVPGVFAFVGVKNSTCDEIWPLHSGKFVPEESALINSVKLYVQMALEFNSQGN